MYPAHPHSVRVLDFEAMTTFLIIAVIYLVGVVLAWGVGRAAAYKLSSDANDPLTVFLIVLSWAGVIGGIVANLIVPATRGRPYLLFHSEPKRKAKALPPVEDVYDFEDKPVAAGIWR